MEKNIIHRIDFKERKIELVDNVIKIEQNIATQIVRISPMFEESKKLIVFFMLQ